MRCMAQSKKKKKKSSPDLGIARFDTVRGQQVCRVMPDGPAGVEIRTSDVERCAQACGSHWFEPGARRFFRSRPSHVAYADRRGGAFFVDSTRGPSDVRRYSVQRFTPGAHGACNIRTVGEFQAYATSAAAHKVAKAAALATRARARR